MIERCSGFWADSAFSSSFALLSRAVLSHATSEAIRAVRNCDVADISCSEAGLVSDFALRE